MRAAGYIRVSREKEGQVSPDFQRSEITAYCARKGWTITDWFEDIDISGRTDQRPGLQELLAGAQDGAFDAVVFYRIDRLSREPAHHYAILAALEEAGVQVDSVGLPADGSPESGFMWDLSAALAKLESLRLGKRLRSMHAQLAREGKYASGPPPFGWQRVRDVDGQQRLVLDSAEASWRRKMHRWYWEGASTREIMTRLNTEAVPTRRDKLWGSRQVQRMLASPVQIGARVVEFEFVITGRIEPLLTEAEYQQTLAIMAARSQGPRRRAGRASALYPLRADLVRCGTCGGPLYLHDDGGRIRYRCERRGQGRCDGGATIKADLLTAYVEKRLLARLARLKPPRRRTRPPADVSPLVREESRLVESLGRLTALYSEGRVGDDEYTQARKIQRKRLETVRARLEKMAAQVEAQALRPSDEAWVELVAITPESWRVLPVQVQRQICLILIERVTVNPVGNGPRIELRWR